MNNHEDYVVISLIYSVWSSFMAFGAWLAKKTWFKIFLVAAIVFWSIFAGVCACK